MTFQVPVPLGLAEKIADFLQKGKTGQVLLNVHEGRIQSYEFKEHFRVKAEDVAHDGMKRV